MKKTLLCISLLIPQLAMGAGYYLPNQDAFATGRGNAFVATADRASAVFYNPAGLVQMDADSLEAGVYAIRLGNEVSNAVGSTSADKEWQFAPHIYYARPINEKLVIGFGLNSPFGLGTDWGNGNTGFRTVINDASLKMATFTIAFGYRINECLSVGGGISFNYLDAALQQGVGFVPGDYLEFEGDDFAISGSAGILWQPHVKHSFGATLALGTDTDLKGKVSTNSGFLAEGNASLDFVTPLRIAAGYSYRPTPRWNIEVNVEWLDWDSLDTLTLKSPNGNAPVPFEWDASFIFEIGASYKLDNGYVFSIGYDFNESAQPDRFFNPAMADADRHWVNIGIGRELEDWNWNLAYQYGYSNRKVTGSVIGTNGKYEARHHGVLLSAQMRF